MLDRLIAEKLIADTLEQKMKTQAIEDDESPAPKAKAKATKLKLSKPGQKALRKVTKSKRPEPKNKPIETEPEKSGEKRGKDEEVQIKETPIAAPKKKAKKTSEKEDDAKDIMRSIKKAAKRPAKGPEEFFIGDDASPKTQNIKKLAQSGSKVPTVKRRRGRNKNLPMLV